MTLHNFTRKAAFERGQTRAPLKAKLVCLAGNEPQDAVDKWPRGRSLAFIIGVCSVGWSLIVAAIIIPGAGLPIAATFFISLAALLFALARQRRGS